ncbi:MAG: dihydrolipoyllysine-residue acetyltransferase component of pyruvate dehydrogenase complex [Candidatus Xenolissoclinum pacificiensis L6]|uniref:Dihydrolipoamide acetyltransferase component of pyruvate dehydrogenase complex n=1 Tax=Candidatus Xenolissoclinum pacificiensis L6 TaxID=1401685 RepID=W2V186_9RICK|nr:MAG: dihydrolipoyllysine-residue acetyltransferase component of pyruvate dehydrogenase complex [Candidatus Xenolissoclinum pacificiensis L6]
MEKGNLQRWFKKEGDSVSSGDVIAEIETDKAVVELESLDDGVLHTIVVPDNSKDVPVGSIIALLKEEGDDDQDVLKLLNNASDTKNSPSAEVSKESQNISLEKDTALDHQVSINNSERIKISPLAKKLSEINKVSLNGMVGSGPGGRIVKSDVLSQIDKVPNNTIAHSHQDISSSTVSPMRMAIASRLTESKTTIPHFYLSVDCSVDDLVKYKKQIKEQSQKNITINDFVVKAVAMSVAQYPDVNSYWQKDQIIKNSQVDVAVAVAIEDGLITPIVKNCDSKTITAVSAEIKSLAEKAKNKSLKPEEFQGGSVTVSNLGMYGIKEFFAIINPPQSAIISVGAAYKIPCFNENDHIVPKQIMNISLSCDHRVVDGVLASMFLQSIKNYLENPMLIVI